MSSSARFCQLVSSAYKNNDLNGAISAYNDWQSSQCYHPTWQWVYDAHFQQHRKVLVPCGRCYHCLETKINSWVTRMYAHAEDFKHVYFITLTYRSFDLAHEPERIMMDVLGQAIWHKDLFNERQRLCYSPCLLIKKHYQLFLKRLRKNTGFNDITYVLSGEYGKQYGRPHFHLVLFSNNPITKRDVDRAWSVALWRSNDGTWSRKTSQKNNGRPFYFSIGKVDFNDLVANGSFNTDCKIKVEGQYLNSARCFAYVCKYLQKVDSVNYSRVSLAYNSLYKKDIFIKLYGNEMSYSIAREYLKDHGYPYTENDNNLLYNNKLLKSLSYEKIIDYDSPLICGTYQRNYVQTLFGHSCTVEAYPRVFVDFRDRFAPFVEFSRGVPIGSLYATRHLQEFKDGVYKKPILQDSSFVVPAYFRSKARESLFGLRRMRKTIKGTSYILGALSDFKRLFESFNADGFSLPFSVPRWKTSQDYCTLLRDPIYTLRDVGTKEKMLVIGDIVKHFKYDRSKRDYFISRQMPVKDWIKNWCCKFLLEYDLHDSEIALSREQARLRDRSLLMMTDMGVDTTNLRDRFIASQDEYLKRKQFDYDHLHKSAE